MPIEKIHSKEKINPESVTSLNSTIVLAMHTKKREYRQKIRSIRLYCDSKILAVTYIQLELL